MAGSCCENNCVTEALQKEQKGTLIKVLWINAVMFLVIAGAALFGSSSALLSDSLDNLFKGVLILFGALVVIAQVAWKVLHPITPSFEVMGIFSLVGVAANGFCLWLLWHHRNEDINMSSVFECSRNDIASNLSVLAAAVGVWFFHSGWPDIVVASCLAVLLLKSAARVIQGAVLELRRIT